MTCGTERLYELSIEVRDLVQSKVGTTAFSTVWEQLRKRSVEKRGNRKAEQHRMVSDCAVSLCDDAMLIDWLLDRPLRIPKRMAGEENSGQT